MNVPHNTKGVNPRLYVLIAVPTVLGIAHHIDHVIRGNHVGWPIAPTVNSFTYSLLIYPIVGVGLYLSLKEYVGVRYWIVTATLGTVLLWLFHFSPWAVEPPSDVILPYANPSLGYLAFAILIGLVLSLVLTTGYATYRWRTWQS
jgi:hypothetical protein